MPRWRASASLAGVSTTRWPRRDEQQLDVGRDDVLASVEQSPPAGCALEREAAADRCSDRRRRHLARRADERHDPLGEGVEVHRGDGPLEHLDLLHPDDRAERCKRVGRADPRSPGAPPRRRDSRARYAGRSGPAGPRAAGTSPRTRSGSPWPAAGTDGDGLRRPVTVTWRSAIASSSGLRLRGRPVDLVDQHHVREDRTRPELEVTRALVVDREPGDVGGLEVGRALDPHADGALDGLGDGARERSSPCPARPRTGRARRRRER